MRHEDGEMYRKKRGVKIKERLGLGKEKGVDRRWIRKAESYLVGWRVKGGGV